MDKIKIGVLGLYRGSSMINYCLAADNAELVAICDKVIPVSESVTMLRNINLSGGNAKLKICYGIEHNVWDIAYSDDELENWLLSHRKM